MQKGHMNVKFIFLNGIIYFLVILFLTQLKNITMQLINLRYFSTKREFIYIEKPLVLKMF